MSDLFWIGRNLNVELGLLEQRLRVEQNIPQESIEQILLPLRAIAGLLIGAGGVDPGSFEAATGFRRPSGP